MTYGLVDGEMTELSYDSRNRLIKSVDISYVYDCENIRISKETSDSKLPTVLHIVGKLLEKRCWGGAGGHIFADEVPYNR